MGDSKTFNFFFTFFEKNVSYKSYRVYKALFTDLISLTLNTLNLNVKINHNERSLSGFFY